MEQNINNITNDDNELTQNIDSIMHDDNVELIQNILLSNPNKINDRTFISKIFINNATKILQYLITEFGILNHVLFIPILMSYQNTHMTISILELLVSNGFDLFQTVSLSVVPKTIGERILISACEKSKFKIIKFLIEYGVDINAEDGSAFLMSCKSKNAYIIQYFIDCGIDPSYYDYGLYYAIKFKKPENIRILLSAGANHYNLDKYIEQDNYNSFYNDEYVSMKLCLDAGIDPHALFKIYCSY